ncbi:uncharacterized protein KIAA1958 homolog [Littorina saxatilis]|uniref:uncharacterized protein KIAA1958 homolog n=1 Tax=Littorina saxatilis TaxID=31220 RepID=UPI0038B573E4
MIYDFSPIDSFVQTNKNKNTLRKTVYDIRRLSTFMAKHGDKRNICTIQPQELCKILCSFFMSLKKPDGKEYEPSTLRGLLSSIHRQLKSKKYCASVIDGPEFAQLREVVKTKQKIVKQEGCGNLPNRAQPLKDEDVDKLWQTKQLGVADPEAILNTLWWQNTVNFGLRSVTPHRHMQWGDVSLHEDSNGREYLQFCERQSKTCQGDNPKSVRDVCPKAWALNNERCPVAVYKTYAALRPKGYSETSSPFYCATNTKVASEECPWFKRQPVGVNKLSATMKNMCRKAGIINPRYTNHSARKFLVQKLSENNVPPTKIMQLSGHKNVQSINNYSSISQEEHRGFSLMLNGTAPVSELSADDTLVSPASATSTPAVSTATATITSQQTLTTLFAGPVHVGTININQYLCSHQTEK